MTSSVNTPRLHVIESGLEGTTDFSPSIPKTSDHTSTSYLRYDGIEQRIMSIPAFALPGDHLASSSAYKVGSGTHANGPQLFASISGPVTTTATKKSLPTVSLSGSSSSSTTAVIPLVGDVVLGRVTRTNPRQATLDILSLGMSGAQVLREPFQALIRQQDIRATEVDKVKVSESFRVGDIVRGVVISLGDERNYYVSTARNEYGVVMARSEADNMMVPVSWKEMRDTATGTGDLRKVAKVV